MPDQMMNTQEVSRYLGIHEKKVYALIKANRIPASRATGKWIFPKKIIDEWIEENAREGLVQVQHRTRKISGALLASGSNDPILDMLQAKLQQHPEIYLFSANIGSMAGLTALSNGLTDIAWCHLFDPKTGDYNVSYLDSHVSQLKTIVVNLFHREIGFITHAKNPLDIGNFQDISRRGVRYINRQKGSGTRLLLDHHLKKARIPAQKIKGYEKEVYTHFEVGLAVLRKEADAGLATSAVAKLLGLSFIPVTWERFDMVLDQDVFFKKEVQAFLNILRESDFHKWVEKIGGYDFKDTGKVLHTAS